MAKYKTLVWIEGEVKSPPFSRAARLQAGFLLRQIQAGENIGMPHCRPMPSIGRRCYELRVQDERLAWRIIYRADSDAIVIVEVFSKKTQATPKYVSDACKQRLKRYDET